ncbi:hypothetical protein V5799_025058 [Amblyomma americanum]|uniref:GH18 domain-containing protein n=1 Tax=Amblyomma americanum TaxID=6943 RepID=A0AAQ4EAC4_AMBAM
MSETKKEFLLTASVSAIPAIMLNAYDVRGLAKHLDFINLMAYDLDFFHRRRPHTSHHSPLFPKLLSKHNEETTYSVVSAVDHWAELGMPHEKMVLGIPLYARTYHLAHPTHHGWGSKALGPGPGHGILPYNQVRGQWRCGQRTSPNASQQAADSHVVTPEYVAIAEYCVQVHWLQSFRE